MEPLIAHPVHLSAKESQAMESKRKTKIAMITTKSQVMAAVQQ